MAYQSATDDDAKLVLTDDDFLIICADELRQSVGFEQIGDGSAELAANREKALEYIKGEMTDMPSLPNRSTAVSTDVSDAIETVLPDIMEVFTGGEDVATFRPQGAEDEEAAAQETDYVNHVFFNENRGWLALYTKFKDALSTKIGVVKVWGETYEETEEEHFTGKTTVEMQLVQASIEAQDGAEIEDLIAGEPDPITGEPLWNFTLKRTKSLGKACVKAVPPEDFGVARDAVVIADATYCVMRSRPRAQDLIADGYDRELVEDLSPYGVTDTEAVEQARDNAGEHATGTALTSTDFNLHQVEIREHYVRVDADGDGQPELWCVVTGNDEAVLLKKERVDRIPFAVSTPFLVTHRLFGRSLFDLLGEVQKIKTALLRLMLDSGYFALNQRYEVAMAAGKANQFTLSDLLNMIPGAPVRSNDGQSVRALGGGRLDFDVAGALEYVSTMAEQRAGVVRNAQGLNPDTLHETKGGMEKLFSAAQKRVRMICRVFAETGVKDMFLLLHSVLRSMPSQRAVARLRGKWVEVDPTEWGARNDMTIHVGVGSGGRETEMAGLNMVIGAQKQLVELQGMTTDGPYIKAQNLYNSAKRLTKLAGLEGVELYFNEPPPDDPNAPKPPPPPDPKMVEAQQKAELERYKIDRQHEQAMEEIRLKDERERAQAEAEFQLRREQLAAEARIKAMGIATGGLGHEVQLGGEMG
jgi:hypothetical protein